MKCLPNFLETKRVVPLPQKGSRTQSPRLVDARRHVSTSFSGKTAKWASGNLDKGIDHTVRLFLPR